MGKDEKGLIDSAVRFGAPLSDRIVNAPELQHGLQIYVDAFNTLTRSRSMSQGSIGSIPYSEISSYCRDHEITGDDREEAIYLIQQMDDTYCKWQADSFKKKMEADKRAAKVSTKGRNR